MKATVFMTAAVAALTLSGCAKSPESIQPAYVSPFLYNNLSCDQLGEEMVRVTQALTTANQQQSDARSNDTIGVIFLGLPVSSLSGGNVAPQIAELKGEQKTLRQVMIRNECSPSIISEVDKMIAETATASEDEDLPEYCNVAFPPDECKDR